MIVAKKKRRNRESAGMRFLRKLVNTGLFLLVVLGITYLVVNYVTNRTLVHGSSMEATLSDGDSIMMDKLSYRFQEPERFDIVSFPYNDPAHPYLIKRIIGLPGETIQIMNGKIYINQEVLQESYGLEVIQSGGLADQPVTLGADEYFVMGDNRNDSVDSRFAEVGNVRKQDITGRAWLQVWPFNDFGLVRNK